MTLNLGPIHLRASISPVPKSWRERGRMGWYLFLNVQWGVYEFECSNGSLQPWGHCKLHRREYETHLVAGPMSISYGTPGLEPIEVCRACGEATEGLSAGDEYWTYCSGCQHVEPYTIEVTLTEYEARS